MRVVVVVPWRGGDAQRERIWLYIAPYLQAFGWPVYLGDRPGPWSRAAACNAGAKDAGPWDVMLVADADTIPDADATRHAVDVAYERSGAIRPHDHLYMLNRIETQRVLQHGPGRYRPVRNTLENLGGGLLVMSRAAYERVGGYDEQFVGWGHEDSALSIKLLVDAYWDRVPGRALHLWHPRDDGKTPQRYANRKRLLDLQLKYSDRIEAEGRRRGWDVGSVL